MVMTAGLLLASEESEAVKLIIGAVFVIGSLILGAMKKAQEERQRGAKTPTTRPPTAPRPQTPPVPRPRPAADEPMWTQPQSLPRSTLTPRSTSQPRGPVEIPTPRRMPQPQRGPAPQRAPSPPVARAPSRTGTTQSVPRRAARAEPVIELELVAAPATPVKTPPPAASRRHGAALTLSAAQLRQLLNERKSLTAAVVLAEVLGPPTALREERF
jgi:hypothetical protein